MTWLLVVLAGYLIGSVDFAVIVSKARGVDIYAEGSGNPGASNVMRTMGRGAAAVVLLGDGLKGVIAAWVGFAFFDGVVAAAAAGFAAVVGHCFPIWHRFKGGKGVATSLGVFVVVLPWWLTIALLAGWALIVGLTRKASLGSLLVMVAVVPAAWLAGAEGAAIGWLTALVVLVIVRHRENLARLRAGEEHAVVSE